MKNASILDEEKNAIFEAAMEDVDDFFKYLASKIKDPVPGKNRKCCILLIGMYSVSQKSEPNPLISGVPA